jgi:hypothetical protein
VRAFITPGRTFTLLRTGRVTQAKRTCNTHQEKWLLAEVAVCYRMQTGCATLSPGALRGRHGQPACRSQGVINVPDRWPGPGAASRHPGPGRSPPDLAAPFQPNPPCERWSVTTKPRARSAANRGPAPFNDRPDGKLEEIVSVRFSTEELRRIQAYATILEMTPNGVIREACSFFLASKVGGPDYLKAVEAYHRRTSEVVEVLEQIENTR